MACNNCKCKQKNSLDRQFSEMSADDKARKVAHGLLKDYVERSHIHADNPMFNAIYRLLAKLERGGVCHL